MKRAIFHGIIILISVITTCVGQNDTLNKGNTILVKWNPGSLLGYPALQFAGEFYYKSKKSCQIEYGIILPNIGLGEAVNKGHKIRIEQRNYSGKKERFYSSRELHFMSVRFDEERRFSQDWSDNTYLDIIGIQKYVFSANLKIGFQHVFEKSKLLLDLYCGLGIRYINTKFVSYPATGNHLPSDMFFLARPAWYKGERLTPNAIVGIKLGYQIK